MTRPLFLSEVSMHVCGSAPPCAEPLLGVHCGQLAVHVNHVDISCAGSTGEGQGQADKSERHPHVDTVSIDPRRGRNKCLMEQVRRWGLRGGGRRHS